MKQIGFFALVLSLAYNQLAVAQTARSKPQAVEAVASTLVPREEKLGYDSLISAKYACIEASTVYLKKFEDVVCEPVVVTNVRTLRWNTIVADTVHSGNTVDESRSSYSSSYSSSSFFVGEIVSVLATPFAAIANAITCYACGESSSSSSRSSNYRRTETPVYSTIYKAIPQYKDEVVRSFGYRLLTSPTQARLSSKADSTLFQSNKRYSSREGAVMDCALYGRILSGYRVVGSCEMDENEQEGYFTWSFKGKPYFETTK